MSNKMVRDTLTHYFNRIYLDAVTQTISMPEKPGSEYLLVDYQFLKNPATRQKLVENFTNGIMARAKDIEGLLKHYVPEVTFEQFAQNAEAEIRSGIEHHREYFKLDVFDFYRNKILKETLDDKVKKI
jgi:hypothetical protein